MDLPETNAICWLIILLAQCPTKCDTLKPGCLNHGNIDLQSATLVRHQITALLCITKDSNSLLSNQALTTICLVFARWTVLSQRQNVDTLLVECWASVTASGSTLNQQLIRSSSERSSESRRRPRIGRTTQQAQNIETMLFQCWPSVYDVGPILI